ncbi:tetraspanin-13-like [Saccoglossus kowalevskii]|uniref:Tetraspanin-31-like n=1 Tax=Saccoglossus kowalevskii TaxID=10224 RepID=A0ABM0MW10_SACKO|nr:PREDICTED: tetraspanin-31-like [Saccoglossus kowalevskii]
MACGGFACSKNALVALNVLYMFVSFILIGVAAYGRILAIVTSIAIIGGIIACGVFLFFIALVGLVGAVKHHQVLLFFYMIILFLVFLLQFAISCACLALDLEARRQLVTAGWAHTSAQTKEEAQVRINCCGLYSQNETVPGQRDHPDCVDTHVPCCGEGKNIGDYCPECRTCIAAIEDTMEKALRISGGVGLFFSFTELLGVWLAVRYRNQKDPRANPSAFL